MAKHYFNTDNSQRNLRRLTELLTQHRALPTSKIAEMLHMTQTNACAYIKYMREKQKIVKIIKWLLILKKGLPFESHMYIPAYGLGSGREAKKPRAKTNTERNRLNRERKKSDPDGALELELRYQRHNAQRKKTMADPLVSLFFGK